MPYDMEKLRKLMEAPDPPDPPEAPDAPAETRILQLSVDELKDAPPELNRFRLLPEDKFAELREDIRLNGILSPLLVRRLADGSWQILAGRNRRRAARELGYNTVPCIPKEADGDDEARLVINADNRQYRESLPSELGWSYRDELEIRSRQGQRTDLTFSRTGKKLDTNSDMASQIGASKTKIHRYIRLTYLIPELLVLVDRKKIGLTVGEQLSFLSKHSQEIVYGYCYAEDPGHPLKEAQAKALRAAEADPDRIIDQDLLEELTAAKPKLRFRTLKLEMAPLRDYFPAGTPEEVVVQTIRTALSVYFEGKEE